MLNREEIAGWFRPGLKVAAITGAGMSTDSGIPDFRSSEGLYNQTQKMTIPMEEVLSIDFFKHYPKEFYQVYREKLSIKEAEPNSGHLFLRKLEEKGLDVTIITQNIDGLHQKAGSSHVLEIHGNAHRFITESGEAVDNDSIVEEEGLLKADGETIRPAITLYGEQLDETIMRESLQAVRQADILLVMGTSLIVYPAAGLIYDYHGEKSILVNRGMTPLDSYFTAVYDESIKTWVEDFLKRI